MRKEVSVLTYDILHCAEDVLYQDTSRCDVEYIQYSLLYDTTRGLLLPSLLLLLVLCKLYTKHKYYKEKDTKHDDLKY